MKKYKLPLQNSSEIIFRTLSAEESDKYYFALKKENPEIEEYIFNLITDYKYNLDKLNAGIIPITLYCALKLSGAITKIEDVPDRIEDNRKKIAENLYFALFKTIKKAQPLYKLSELKNLTFSELIEEFTFSEMLLGKEDIDTTAMRSALKGEKKEDKPKGIKSVTKDEINAIKEYFNSNELNGQFIDERY